MSEKKQKIILDFGCGLGNNFKPLSKRGKYFAVDILEKNINTAKANHPEGKFYLFDGIHTPFADSFFDEIHIYDVLEHVEDLNAVLAELVRVSGRGCEIFITVPAGVSEKRLLKAKPSYFEEVGHLRIVDIKQLEVSMNLANFELVKSKKVRGMEAVFLYLIFLLRNKGKSVEYQTGSPKFSKYIVALIWLFDARLFLTPLRYFFFIYVFTLLIGYIVSRFFPKAIYLVFKKI